MLENSRLRYENAKLQRDNADLRYRMAAAGAAPPLCCCQKPPCCCGILQPVVLFHVRQAVRYSMANIGSTIDLSVALSYKDAQPSRTWISVSRGFKHPTTGVLYSTAQEPLTTLVPRN